MLHLTDIGIFYSLHMGNDVMITYNLDLFINFIFLVTYLQLLEFYQMDKPHYQIQRVKLRIIKMPMSVKKELQFRAWSRINESSSYQFIYRGKNGPIFSILLLRVII